MSTTKRLSTSTLILALTLPLIGCGPDLEAAPTGADDAAQSSAASDEAVVDAAPDLDKVSARAAARWDAIVAGDWIQAYDYMTPDAKKLVSLASFLGGKEYHEYRNPTKAFIIDSVGDEAYLEFSVLWETHNPQVVIAANNPGDLTQEMHIIETWTWQDGEWFWVATERTKEFMAAHPEVGKDKAQPETDK